MDGEVQPFPTSGGMFYTAGHLIVRTFYFWTFYFWTFYFMDTSFYEHFFHNLPLNLSGIKSGKEGCVVSGRGRVIGPGWVGELLDG